MGIETLAIAGLVGSAVSGITGFMGSMQQSAAAEAAAKYQAQVARNNQIIAQQNAEYAAAAGAAQAQSRDFRNRAVQGGILAAQAASGIDVGSPTSREVRESAAQIGRLDTETLFANALQTTRGYVNQGTNFESEARLADMRARQASSSGFLSGFGSLLSGASSFASKWASYQDKGIF